MTPQKAVPTHRRGVSESPLVWRIDSLFPGIRLDEWDDNKTDGGPRRSSSRSRMAIGWRTGMKQHKAVRSRAQSRNGEETSTSVFKNPTVADVQVVVASSSFMSC